MRPDIIDCMYRPFRVAAAALLLVGAAACSKKADDGADPVTGGGTTCHGHDLKGEALLDCVGPSLAYVQTPSATGSGVLLDGGYVVTNAHVVDPYERADLTFPDGTTRYDVPVVGIDALADIAVLGPLEHPSRIDAQALSLGTGVKVAKGADVYLIGYPGEADDVPDPTISRGLLSRTRKAQAFGQTYLQTDASIGGGQSGGALVDGDGRVIGISGLEFAEEFALALDGRDVQTAADKIRAGHGDPYGHLPDEATATQDHAYDFVDELDAATLVIAAGDDDRTLQVVLGPTDGVALEVVSLDGEPLLYNEAARELSKATEDDDLSDIGVDMAAPTAPGTFEVDLPAGIETALSVASTSPTPRHVTVHTSEPSAEVHLSPRTPLALGKAVETSFDYFELGDVYTLDLKAGDAVDVEARSPQGDMGVTIRAPGSALADLVLFDDGGGGLYDTDAFDTYKAKVDGTYVFSVFSYDGVVTGYRFKVSKA
jgi:hypothetical protein